MEAYIKARKAHNCDCCGSKIKPGERYLYGEWKGPRWAEDDLKCENKQVGIQYFKSYLCEMCV